MLSISASFIEAATYTYDRANRLIQEEDVSGLIITYTYDDRGNVIQKSVSTGGQFLLTVSKTGTAHPLEAEAPVPTTGKCRATRHMMPFPFITRIRNKELIDGELSADEDSLREKARRN